MPIYVTEMLTGQGYLIVEINETASPYYYLYARPDKSYVIAQDTVVGSTRSCRYYKGCGDSMVADWTGRAALTYGYPYEVW